MPIQYNVMRNCDILYISRAVSYFSGTDYTEKVRPCGTGIVSVC